MKVIDRMALAVSGTKRIIYMGLSVAGAVMFLRSDALAASSETSSLQYTFSSAMTNPGVDPDASGNVNGNLARQGNITNQQLRISLAKLDSNTTYELVAFIGDDINSTNVAELTTSSKGAVKVTYVKKAQGNSSAGGQPLPDALDPLNNIRELDIVNSDAQTVLQVNLTNTTVKLQYLFKSPLGNAGLIPAAVGSLQIKATTTSAQFRLMTMPLLPGWTCWCSEYCG